MPELEFLDPNHITRLAYVHHVAGDQQHAGKPINLVAQKEIDTFQKIKDSFPPLSQEGIYISSVATTMISLAQDITRRKRTYLQELEAADNEYEVAYHQLVKSTWISMVWKAIYMAVKVAFFATLGVFVAQTLAPFIPDGLAHQTGRRAPSIAMMGLFSLGIYIVSYKLSEMSRRAIETMRTWRKQEAVLKYDHGRLTAFRQHWCALVYAWETYAGRQYEQSAYFESMITDDLSVDSQYIMQVRAKQRSLVAATFSLAERRLPQVRNFCQRLVRVFPTPHR